jgi:hypothetical protein
MNRFGGQRNDRSIRRGRSVAECYRPYVSGNCPRQHRCSRSPLEPRACQPVASGSEERDRPFVRVVLASRTLFRDLFRKFTASEPSFRAFPMPIAKGLYASRVPASGLYPDKQAISIIEKLLRSQQRLKVRSGYGNRIVADRFAGKALLIFGNYVKPQNKKYFAFPEMQTGLYHRHPVPTRGALAIVTNVGRGCGGRESCD